LKRFEGVDQDAIFSNVSGSLLQTARGPDENTLRKYLDTSSRENLIKTMTIQLMSTPEYQMC
jgi:hypothetical protein